MAMASTPQDGFEQDMLCAANLRKNVNARRRFIHQPQVWNSFRSVWDRATEPTDRSQWESLVQWYGQILPSLDQSCEQTKFEGSGGFKDDEFDLEGLAVDLICDHSPNESFVLQLSREAIALCLHVANVMAFKCFLYCSRIAVEMMYQQQDAGSLEEMSGLTDELSRLSDKWKWSGDLCENRTYHLWEGSISEAEEEPAVKLLYQWTLLPLSAVILEVSGAVDSHALGDLDAERFRANCGDELCTFLEEYDMFFSIGYVDIDFLYNEISEWYCRTADLYCNLGNYSRARELLEKARRKLKDIDDDTRVTKWGNGGHPIAYQPGLQPVKKIHRELHVLNLLYEVNSNNDHDRRVVVDSINDKNKQLLKEAEKFEWDLEKFTAENDGLIRFPYDRQLYRIIDLIGKESYSEAEMTFKQLDLNQCRSSGVLRDFLEHLNLPQHRCISGSGSPLSWESACEKQNLLLDVSEYINDHQLTSKFLQKYGIMIGEHSFGKLPERYIGIAQAYGIAIKKSESQEAFALKLWLTEELGLELPSPAPERVQEAISCLRDRCSSDEHKRIRPELLKACYLLKRSIDICSGLLHNWTQAAKEEEWLQLLESQKSVHETLQSYLLVVDRLCTECLLESNGPSYVHSDHSRSLTSAIFHRVSATGEFQSACVAFRTGALVWVERGRTRTLLNQLGPLYGDENPGSDSLKEQLITFDNDEQEAMASILSCQMACKGSVSLFMEYVCLGQTIVAFIIDVPNKTTSIVQTCSYEAADRVEKLVNEFYDTVKDLQKLDSKDETYVVAKAEKRAEKAAKLPLLLEELYDMLIGPFWEQALLIYRDPKAALVIVPAKILYRVPFALLRDRKTKKYLFELHTVSIAPSLRVLQHCKQRLCELDRFPLKSEGCILAVGNPAYPVETAPLPGTGEELKHLQSCFPGRVKTFQQHEATRAKFLQQVNEASVSDTGEVFGFVHLGVHGHWSQNGQHKTGSLQFAPPQTSAAGEDSISGSISATAAAAAAVSSGHGEYRRGSAFGEVGCTTSTSRGDQGSTADPETGMLPSEDIVRSGFQWRTRLVVLSACNSSRGEDYNDCEVNLPRALMIAGVPATVVSQWKVSDRATPVLMKAFYKHLQNGQPVASALRSAMLQVYESDRCPSKMVEWGPFVVWGLPTVQLPEELGDDGMKAELRDFQKVNILLELAHVHDGGCRLQEEAMKDAIWAMERLLVTNSSDCRKIAAAEDVYTVVPVELLQRIELELEAARENTQLFDFRKHVMYAQALKGNPQVALGYADKIIEDAVSAWGLSYDHLCVQAYRQERAVIRRLMGEYDAALEEFNQLLAFGEDYECLVQTSYLEALKNNRPGALEYARRAKAVQHSDMSGYCEMHMILGIKALPQEYRQWLLNVDENTQSTSCPV